MKRTTQSRTARNLDSIRSGFLQVRILHYASTAPATAVAITDKLCARSGVTNLARTLARMTRSGLLKVKAHPASHAHFALEYSLTPKGRRLLDTTKEHLRQLAAP